MTAFLPARAPTHPGGARSTQTHRRLVHVALATAVVIAGVAGPARDLVAPSRTAGHDTAPTSGVAIDRPHEAEQRSVRPRPAAPAPRPLAPAPPADGRDAPDPFILHDGARYLLYSTQVGLHNVPVATSPDLRHWSPPSDALPRLPDWATWGRTWAPGATRLHGRYLLYFAAQHGRSGRQCIGVATGTTAAGPFVSTAPDPLVCQTHLGGSIDPHPFVDADGSTYLLWKSDGNAIGQHSTLFAQRLRPDGLALTGRPSALLSSDAAWEQPLIENPALIASGRSYMLLYSGGWWESAGYATGYATCTTPLGPCAKVTVDRPLVATTGDQAGPGGACVVTGPGGDQWLAYHAWDPGAVGYANHGARSLRFATLTWPGRHPDVGPGVVPAG
jgi:beta-xylosidase